MAQYLMKLNEHCCSSSGRVCDSVLRHGVPCLPGVRLDKLLEHIHHKDALT